MKTLEDVLQEITPQPDPDFVADMERRMQQGFPPSPKRRRPPRLALPDLRPRAVAAVAASAMLALLVTVSLVGEEGDAPRVESAADTAGELSSGAAREAVAPSSATGTIAPVPPPVEDVAPRAQVRRVERSAQLTLADDPAEFDRLADSIFRTTDRHRGFVLRSTVSQGEDAASSGFFELRVPTQELQPTLNELSRLATVRTRSESGNDVTAPYLSLRDRLRTAQAERKSLLRRLELAETDRAAAAIRRRLEIVGRRITSLQAQFRAVRERTEFSAVLVELVDADADANPAASETDEALDDAVGYLEGILNFLIRAAGILLPVALTALLVWIVASFARRRARDRALA
jgi:hypothetical protein